MLIRSVYANMVFKIEYNALQTSNNPACWNTREINSALYLLKETINSRFKA